MKFLVSFLLTAVLSFISCLYLPWWSVAIVAVLVHACIAQKPWLSFLSGFSAVFLVWVIIAASISSANNHILAHRISQVILKSDSPSGLVGLTGLIGGLVAGFAALAGSFAWKPNSKEWRRSAADKQLQNDEMLNTGGEPAGQL